MVFYHYNHPVEGIDFTIAELEVFLKLEVFFKLEVFLKLEVF